MANIPSAPPLTNELRKDRLYVIFFSSPTTVSRCIRWYERVFIKNAIWSHVGILFHSSVITHVTPLICPGKMKSGKFLVLESTMGGPLNDNVYSTCGKMEFGVQVRDFDELLISYGKDGGNIAVSRVTTINDDMWGMEFNKCLQRYLGARYELIIPNLLTIHLPFIRPIRSKGMFCSEVVACILNDILKLSSIKTKKVSPNKLLELGILSPPVHYV